MSHSNLPMIRGQMSQRFRNFNIPDIAAAARANLVEPFPILSIKGKVFSIRYRGDTYPLTMQNPHGGHPLPLQQFEVVVIGANEALSKQFYAGGWVDGSDDAPTCMSSDGIVPDAGVQQKQSMACQTCPRYAWGSRINEKGKPARECQDGRRIAIVPAHDIDNAQFGGPILLRLPPTSLQGFASYAEKLRSVGVPVNAVTTVLSFNIHETHQVIEFTASRYLDDQETDRVGALATDPRLDRILAVNLPPQAAITYNAPRTIQHQGPVNTQPYDPNDLRPMVPQGPQAPQALPQVALPAYPPQPSAVPMPQTQVIPQPYPAQQPQPSYQPNPTVEQPYYPPQGQAPAYQPQPQPVYQPPQQEAAPAPAPSPERKKGGRKAASADAPQGQVIQGPFRQDQQVQVPQPQQVPVQQVPQPVQAVPQGQVPQGQVPVPQPTQGQVPVPMAEVMQQPVQVAGVHLDSAIDNLLNQKV